MAEPGSIERKAGKFTLACATLLQTLEGEGITEAHNVHARITREQHPFAQKRRDLKQLIFDGYVGPVESHFKVTAKGMKFLGERGAGLDEA